MPFAIVLLGALAALVLWVWLLGRYFPGSGLEQLGLRSARQIVEDREALEAEDLSQMLAAHNERRRRRGEPEVTVADLELQVMNDSASSAAAARPTWPTASSTSCSRPPTPAAAPGDCPSAPAKTSSASSAPAPGCVGVSLGPRPARPPRSD